MGLRKINLRLILVSGKTKEFLFSPSESAGWAEEAVAKAEILRLIYQGRFLHSNVTLGALGLPLGKTTVMHLTSDRRAKEAVAAAALHRAAFCNVPRTLLLSACVSAAYSVMCAAGMRVYMGQTADRTACNHCYSTQDKEEFHIVVIFAG
ncbi:hypothetical protein B566_EDAN011824 [Ephemera danica]|nr:hypothetical protein B566_EDAN011824 [Ephemera danica]